MIALLVTRPLGEADELVSALRQRGYRVHAVPTVVTEQATFDSSSLATCDWIVLTSARGVDAFDVLPAGPRFAAVGTATAQALRARGIEPAHVPAQASGADLGETLPDVAGRRVALVRASAAATDLAERLRARGALVEEVTAYHTVDAPAASTEELHAALADPELRAIVFASGSAVRGFLTLGGARDLAPAVTIGPRTTKAARDAGFDMLAEAREQNVAGLVDAVIHVLPVGETNHA